MKTCTQCHRTLDFSSFHRQHTSKDGYRSSCKECRVSNEIAPYREANRDKLLKRAAEFRARFPDKSKEYYAKNPHYFAVYRAEHSDSYRKWRQDNREYTNAYCRNKRATDPNYKITTALRSRLSTLMKKCYAKKSNSTMELLGCSVSEFRALIESKFLPGMSWDNYGRWHLDHITPCAFFDLRLKSAQEKCFHFSNFQPLWAIDNLRKNCR